MDGVLRVITTPLPSPSATFVFDPPSADPVQTVGAIVAIALALAAAILGYRIIRGGRGL
ncbi:MAG TPA: hypothetical protein VHJ76_06810 [Actinomycetota bacterium]|nr:hypothetical protein [Actinomycetota bacterium]